MTDQPLIGCHGILQHTDTVWQRCPKALECKRYLGSVRHGSESVKRMCQTVEFEHFVRVK
jgi:hypothetical protein